MKSILIESETGNRYQIVPEERIDISIRLQPGNENPNCYGAEPPEFEPVRDGDFIGSIAQGGAVNHKTIRITPHGNGTHTECYGHIYADPDATISQLFSDFWILAHLITLTPSEQDGDQVITEDSFPGELEDDIDGLIIRTLPNTIDKKSRQYTGTNPPYFAPEFIRKTVEQDIRHLLTDLPSLDPESDGGKVRAHKTFWSDDDRSDCTVTELIYVPDQVKDGLYWVNLQVPNLELDAAPSRPVIYPATKV